MAIRLVPKGCAKLVCGAVLGCGGVFVICLGGKYGSNHGSDGESTKADDSSSKT
jgi:hypothetical protein